jgi:NhaA family Na+:H+ antiporter
VLRALLRPVQVFFRLEAASGIVLLAATALALVWANSPWRGLYQHILETPLSLAVGGHAVTFNVHALVNDGLMSVFFFVVGMEIKRELVTGELNSARKALLPAVAALGGMLVPAAIYAAINWGGPGLRGWAVPMATDIAFAIGVLTLLKGRVPNALIVFVTALAIFDDMGGILVIALFYGSGVKLGWLAASAVVTALLFAVGRGGARHWPIYLLFGLALWFTLHEGGVHPTIAGVLLGLAIPARGQLAPREALDRVRAQAVGALELPEEEALHPEALHALEESLEMMEAPLSRFIHRLHPWVAFGIMPAFALASSGVDLSATRMEHLLAPITLGSALGLLVGKQLGIFAFTWLAIRLGLSPAPGGASSAQLYGAAMVAGIGFTVALFIAGLAFPEPLFLAEAKVGILLGSAMAGIAGAAVLRLVGRGARTR